MNDYNPEYDDEAGMADNNLETLKRAVSGLDELISAGDNLPEWCQEKIAVAKSMLVAVWDYMRSEEDRGAIAETKKSHKRPKYSIKPKSSVLPTFQPGGDKKKKKKKNGYFEHLESQLINKLDEYQDRMAGVGMGNYVVDKSPTEAVKPKSSVKCFRQGDEWVVQIKGTIVRIPTDEASSPEEAVAQAMQNLQPSKFKEAFNSDIYSPKAVALGKKFCEFYGITDDLDTQYVTEIIDIELKESEKTGVPFDINKVKSTIAKGLRYTNGRSEYPMKKKFKSNESTWTHDTLAAQLFEQDITYEDQLNRELKRKLGK